MNMIKNYGDITIKTFLKCKLIADLETDPMVRNMKLLAELTDRTMDEVESLPINELLKQLSGISDLGVLKEDAKVNMKYKMKGKTNIIIWRQQDLTGEQYIDATHFCKDSNKLVENIHNVIASLSVELDWLGRRKRYSGETHKERAEWILNNMKISQAYPILVFFCEYSKILVDNTLTFLGEEMMKRLVNIPDLQGLLERNGDGSQL